MRLKQAYPSYRFGDLKDLFSQRTLSGIRTKAVRLKIKKPFKDLKFINLEPSFSLGYTIGVVFGDGNLSSWKERNGAEHFYVRLKAKDKDFVEFFEKHINLIGGHCTTFFDKRGFYNATVHSKSLHIFLKNFPTTEALKMSKDMKRGFLMGIFDSEGTITKRKNCNGHQIKIINKNEQLIDVCKRLLEEFGIKANKYKVGGSSFNPNGTYYNLYIKAESLTNFFVNLGFSIKRKQDRLLELMKFIEGGYYSH